MSQFPIASLIPIISWGRAGWKSHSQLEQSIPHTIQRSATPMDIPVATHHNRMYTFLHRRDVGLKIQTIALEISEYKLVRPIYAKEGLCYTRLNWKMLCNLRRVHSQSGFESRSTREWANSCTILGFQAIQNCLGLGPLLTCSHYLDRPPSSGSRRAQH